jgi:DNA cross-link repair 1A protein
MATSHISQGSSGSGRADGIIGHRTPGNYLERIVLKIPLTYSSRFVESPAVQTVLMSDHWKSRYTMAELVPQRGSTREASCFGVPYSEHSSFRELTIFCCALRIEKVIPTVNVGSAASRAKMKAWIDRWMSERKKNGVIKLGDGAGEVRW